MTPFVIDDTVTQAMAAIAKYANDHVISINDMVNRTPIGVMEGHFFMHEPSGTRIVYSVEETFARVHPDYQAGWRKMRHLSLSVPSPEGINNISYQAVHDLMELTGFTNSFFSDQVTVFTQPMLENRMAMNILELINE